ncbi:MAG: hypothetical protein GFGODING_01371 [Flavobacteriales bacterium]|nr:hypothetical protein [Flavobacteriales bacterium]
MIPLRSLRPLLTCLACWVHFAARAQNIGINVNGAAPHPSALLDIDAGAIVGPKRGLLIPRMTAAERAAIPAPATGLLVYETTTSAFWYFDGIIWVRILSGGGGWSLTGNAGTVPGTNFLGTTDNIPFEVRVNNARAGWIGPGPALTTSANSSWGYQALSSNTTGWANTATGFGALQANTTGSGCTAVGHTALAANTSGASNVAVGNQALHSSTTGNRNTAIGDMALYTNTGGTYNDAHGHRSLYANTTGWQNCGFGTFTLELNTTGSYNTALGHSALHGNTTGNDNTGVGRAALWTNSTGSYNTGSGSHALHLNTTGSYNTAAGFQAAYNNTTGASNAAFGHVALFSNTTGIHNTALGAAALYWNTTGNYNTATGLEALNYNSTGNYNTAGGYRAAQYNSTGTYNTAFGSQALHANTTGDENTAVGASALSANTTGIANDAFGSGALRFNTSGMINSALGSYALGNNTTGGSNVAVGRNALFNNTTGSSNTALGYQAGNLCATGSNNTAIGSFTDLLPNLAYATVVGSGAQASVSNALILGGTGASAVNVGIGTTAPTLAGLQVERMVGNTSGIFRGNTTSQGVALVSDWPGIYFNCYYNGGQRAMAGSGFPAIINSDQGDGGIFFSTTATANTVADALVPLTERMRIRGNGNVGIGTFFPLYLLEVNGVAAKPGGGTWVNTSDARLKTDVRPYDDGLAQLLRIEPVRYRYNEASGHDTKPEYVGVIAQELQKVAPYMVGTFEKEGTEYLNVDNSAMIYMLVNAVKEQQSIIEDLRTRLAAVEAQGGLIDGTGSR